MITDLIEREARAGRYDPPVQPATLGYAIVRLAEAFLFNDAALGSRGDLDRLRDVEAALLNVREWSAGSRTAGSPGTARPSGRGTAAARSERRRPAPPGG